MAFGRYDQWFNPDAVAVSLGADIPAQPSPARSTSPTCSGDDAHSEADPQVNDEGFEIADLVTDVAAGEPEQEEEPDHGFSIDHVAASASSSSSSAAQGSAVKKARRKRSASESAQRAAKAPKMFRHKDAVAKKAIDVRAHSPPQLFAL